MSSLKPGAAKLTYEQKRGIESIVRKSAAAHVLTTSLAAVHKHYGTLELRNLAHEYAVEVREDIARSIDPAHQS
jgi:hypothetical protein